MIRRRLVGILVGALFVLGACAAAPGASSRPAPDFSPCVDQFSGYVARECR
jgi:hypothetical protein